MEEKGVRASDLITGSGACPQCTRSDQPKMPSTKKEIWRPLRNILIGLFFCVVGFLGAGVLVKTEVNSLVAVGSVFASVIVVFAAVLLIAFLVNVLEWFFKNFIGRRNYYYFLDEDDRLHIHARKLVDDAAWRSWFVKFSHDRAVLQLRHGGWLRKNAVIGRRGRFWSVKRAWFGYQDLQIVDAAGNMLLHVYAEGQLHGLRKTLQIMNAFRSVSETCKTPESVIAVRNALGVTIYKVLAMISSLRVTMGRSEHAKSIRSLLETCLKAIEVEFPGFEENLTAKYQSTAEEWWQEEMHEESLVSADASAER